MVKTGQSKPAARTSFSKPARRLVPQNSGYSTNAKWRKPRPSMWRRGALRVSTRRATRRALAAERAGADVADAGADAADAGADAGTNHLSHGLTIILRDFNAVVAKLPRNAVISRAILPFRRYG